MASQSYEASQQAYQCDHYQNQAAYYSYQPQYYHQQPPPPQSYPYYPYNSHDGSNFNNQQVQDSSIHPPGVPPPAPPPAPELTITASAHDYSNQQNSYYYAYPNAGIAAIPTPSGSHLPPPQIAQTSNVVTSNMGNHSSHRSGQGQFSTFHGQGLAMPLAQGAVKLPNAAPQSVQPSYASASGLAKKPGKAKKHPKKVQQPPQAAWCELCKVDCNSLDIFEQHKNGKKHKKNLKVFNELQALNTNLAEVQGGLASASQHKPGVPSQIEKVGGSDDKQLLQETSSSIAVTKAEVESGDQKVGDADTADKSAARKQNKRILEHGGKGLKRKMNSGKGVNKWMRSCDGSKRPVEPPKPKVVVPLICELCNVKCESPAVFQAHLAGKKHIANLKRFQGEQAIIGQAALQAIYPALQALYPALQALCQADIGTLISQLQQQGLLGVQPQSGPLFSQGQVSEMAAAAAATLSALPQSTVITQQQQSFQPEGSIAAGGGQIAAVSCDGGGSSGVEEAKAPPSAS